VELLNIDDAMSRLNNNKSLYLRLLKKFDAKSMLDDLLEKLKSGNVASSQAAAHTIKGLAANLSLEDLRAKAEVIDKQLKGGDINVDTADIEKSVELTIEAVNTWIAENS
jgi:HPt (histidine-containing phosphotransfer) domain-containing protein